jgi:phosphate transport system permease protein
MLMVATKPPMEGKRLERPKGAGFDPVFRALCFASATLLLSALGGLLLSLFIGGWAAFEAFGPEFFVSTRWNPVKDIYGAAGPIVGTLVTAFLALLLSLPIAFGVAVFLTEFCPAPLRRPIGTAIELLAGIPSIVYGMWGLFVFAPLFADHVQVPIMSAAPVGSIWETLTWGVPNGSGLLTASIILAVMILPYMAATFRELFLGVPAKLRESAFGVGATTLEVVWSVTLPYVRRSAVGAVMLGLGRALGETMAVTFVIGNAHGLPSSIFDSGSTIASTIANEFAEASSPMHAASLVALGFVLFLITFGVLAVARAFLGPKGQP